MVWCCLVFGEGLSPLLSPANEGETGKQSDKLPAVSLGDDLRVWQVPLIGAMTLEAVNNLVRFSVTKRSGPANISQINLASVAVVGNAQLMETLLNRILQLDKKRGVNAFNPKQLDNVCGFVGGCRMSVSLRECEAGENLHGGKIPRARCGFVVVFHTGDKIGRDGFRVKLFFKLFLISLERSFESGRHGIFQFEMTRAAGMGKSRMKSNVRFIPDGAGDSGEGDRLRSAPRARRAGQGCLLPVGNGSEWGGICFGICPQNPPTIAPQSRQIGGESGVLPYAAHREKGMAGRISRESAIICKAWTEGDRERAGTGTQGKASGTGPASQRNPTATSDSPINAQTPTPRVLGSTFSWREHVDQHKYPISNDLCKIYF